MKRLAVGGTMVLIAALLGIFSAWLMLRMGGGAVVNGAWRTGLTVGSTSADPYTRARIAIGGLFALNRSETVYFAARTDDDGQPLRGACSYRITGTTLPARWWSITAYGTDHFLIPNAPGRYSFNMKTVEPDVAGAFELTASGREQQGRWLPTGPDGFELTLRLYNPAAQVVAYPDRLELPRIKRQGDC